MPAQYDPVALARAGAIVSNFVTRSCSLAMVTVERLGSRTGATQTLLRCQRQLRLRAFRIPDLRRLTAPLPTSCQHDFGCRAPQAVRSERCVR